MSGKFDYLPPGESDLLRLYHELAKEGAPCVGKKVRWSCRPDSLEALMVIAGDMLRYDARLLTILLQLVLRRWRELHPLRLRFALRQGRFPQALLVVFEFARLATNEKEITWMAEYLGAGVARVSPAEQFFIGMHVPGSRTAQRHSGRNLSPYARWGFIGTERPVADMDSRRTVGRYDADSRRRILDAMLQRAGHVTVGEYLHAVEFSITRQQALGDLKRNRRLVLEGRGRGARWVLSDDDPVAFDP